MGPYLSVPRLDERKLLFRAIIEAAVRMPHSSPIRVKPEIMSPAGHWPQLRAAIEAGADSVYFGLTHFTARAKVGFSLEELPSAMATLHRRCVKGFITFNTLIFEHELSAAARAIAAIAEAGADALIVQDLGILKLARQIAPDLELHGSTQMSITSAEGVEMARELGVDRVTLARELSLDEIRKLRAATSCDLEMFVHGALCVAYSGQCFSSEAWGGRSANRGQCAQACRLPYDLIVDGSAQPLGDSRYLLSPGDLYTIEQIPEIVEIGISALKIEGRYKDADYVALTTRAYRKAVDEAWEGRRSSRSAAEKQQLEQVYSRGLGPHFVSGTNHQAVVQGRSPRHRGVKLGQVVRVHANSVEIEPSEAHAISPVKPGDGLMFDAADWRSPQDAEEGGRVFQVLAKHGGRLELLFGNGVVKFDRVRAGDLVWRTSDPEIDRVVRPYLEAVVPLHKQAIRAQVRAHVGELLRVVWTLLKRPAVSVTVQSPDVLVAAQNRGVSAEYLHEQLGRLGNSAYRLAEMEADIQGLPFVPASLLNQMRRHAVDQLQELQGRLPGIQVHQVSIPEVSHEQNSMREPQLHLLVRTPEQLDGALDLRPASITLDYLDLYGLKPSVERVKAAGIDVRTAAPRVLKPGEERVVDFLLRLDTAILVRSSGLLEMLRERSHQALIGDFSLNAANSLTADLLLKLGLTRITPTHDLNAAQVAALARQLGGEAVEAIVYQHLPVFHTEHCVFCRFLSTGTSFKDCGRPCERHTVSLRDVNGRSHPLLADIGCRNTVFGAEAQEASVHLEDWRAAGIRHFRLEFAHETNTQVMRVVKSFRDALQGRISYAQLTQQWKRVSPQGTTEGSLFVPANHLALTVLQ
jgi:putative protease